jgi:hypothetical protein
METVVTAIARMDTAAGVGSYVICLIYLQPEHYYRESAARLAVVSGTLFSLFLIP